MVCRNLCQRFDSRVPVGKAHYGNRNKYCRRYEVYFFHDGVFCPCCGMALRMSPTSKRDKEKLRQLKEKEQDRVIRIIKRIKK